MHKDKLTDVAVTINPMKFVSYNDVMLTFSDCWSNHVSCVFRRNKFRGHANLILILLLFTELTAKKEHVEPSALAKARVTTVLLRAQFVRRSVCPKHRVF